MIQALHIAMTGYAARANDLEKVASNVASRHGDSEIGRDMVDMIATQRAAEANLAVAKVADTLGESLIHIIA